MRGQVSTADQVVARIARDTRRYRGIPTLTVAATLVDLAARDVDLGLAVFRADSFHGVTVHAVAAAARRRGPFPGIGKLRALYTGDAPILLSLLEEKFVAFLTENGLPLPRTNRKENSHYVDCRWPTFALTVELDNYRFHNSRKTSSAATRGSTSSRTRPTCSQTSRRCSRSVSVGA
jgi:hypothetical protein